MTSIPLPRLPDNSSIRTYPINYAASDTDSESESQTDLSVVDNDDDEMIDIKKKARPEQRIFRSDDRDWMDTAGTGLEYT